MKKKKILSTLTAMLLAISLFSGCSAETSANNAPYSPQEQELSEPVAAVEQNSITVKPYPVDLDYTEYVELVISEKLEVPADTDSTSTQTEGETQPPQVYAATQQSENSINEPELKQSDPSESTSTSSDEGIKIGDEPATEEEPNVIVFRYRETDMANGSVIYHIQVQKQVTEGMVIFGGTMSQGEDIVWDTGEYVLLQARVAKELLEEIDWTPCVRYGVYANNRALQKCVVSGQNVIYTNSDYTRFQIQSYNADGSLSDVKALSQDDAKQLLNGAVTPIAWSDNPYPEVYFTVEERSVSDNTELQEEIISYEEKINGLNQEIANTEKIIIELYVAIGLLAVTNLVCLILLVKRKRRHTKRKRKTPNADQLSQTVGNVRNFGTVHNIGGRSGQQDSFDVIKCSAGTLAVVADGMGGLADGDKVSQKIVATMRADSARIRPGKTDSALWQMVAHANQEVNRMLGASRQYKCGSTLLAVLIENDTLQWITVGDSRIYLYRGGKLIQINREHIYRKELLVRAINGKISFAETVHDPQAERLSSFVGMGELKYVDFSFNRLKLCAGDHILLMSDGVFNTLTEDEIADTIRSSESASDAAVILEEKVLKKNAPNQDNFTCVILQV